MSNDNDSVEIGFHDSVIDRNVPMSNISAIRDNIVSNDNRNDGKESDTSSDTIINDTSSNEGSDVNSDSDSGSISQPEKSDYELLREKNIADNMIEVSV